MCVFVLSKCRILPTCCLNHGHKCIYICIHNALDAHICLYLQWLLTFPLYVFTTFNQTSQWNFFQSFHCHIQWCDYFGIVVNSHIVVRNNTERAHVLFTQFSPVTLCKTWGNITRTLTSIQPTDLTQISQFSYFKNTANLVRNDIPLFFKFAFLKFLSEFEHFLIFKCHFYRFFLLLVAASFPTYLLEFW